jgi:hypothetical protein
LSPSAKANSGAARASASVARIFLACSSMTGMVAVTGGAHHRLVPRAVADDGGQHLCGRLVLSSLPLPATTELGDPLDPAARRVAAASTRMIRHYERIDGGS